MEGTTAFENTTLYSLSAAFLSEVNMKARNKRNMSTVLFSGGMLLKRGMGNGQWRMQN